MHYVVTLKHGRYWTVCAGGVAHSTLETIPEGTASLNTNLDLEDENYFADRGRRGQDSSTINRSNFGLFFRQKSIYFRFSLLAAANLLIQFTEGIHWTGHFGAHAWVNVTPPTSTGEIKLISHTFQGFIQDFGLGGGSFVQRSYSILD